MSYAQLVHAGDVMDNAIGRFYQSTQERVTDISAITLFFGLELNRIDDAVMARQLADPALAHYAPWIRDSRAYRPHQLSDEVEQVLHEKQRGRARRVGAPVRRDHGASAHPRSTASELTETEILDLMVDKDRTVRRDASPRRSARRPGQGGAQLRPGHQHAGQGQGDRGPLAPLPPADLVPQSVEPRSRTRWSTR